MKKLILFACVIAGLAGSSFADLKTGNLRTPLDFCNHTLTVVDIIAVGPSVDDKGYTIVRVDALISPPLANDYWAYELEDSHKIHWISKRRSDWGTGLMIFFSIPSEMVTAGGFKVFVRDNQDQNFALISP